MFVEGLRIHPATQDNAALTHDLLSELRQHFSIPETVSDEQLLQICKQGSGKLIQEWREKNIDANNPASILKFYSETQAYCYELVALDLAATEARKQQLAEFSNSLRQLGKKRGLDFGSGIGSTGIYLIKNGFDCEFADVSRTNLGFIQLRLRNRKLQSKTHQLPEAKIPQGSYDFILAMDVLEHVADPMEKIRELRTYLKADGVLLFNVIAGHSEDDPLHIMHDPFLIRKRIRSFGFNKIGSIGEFKIYRRVERPKLVNAVWNALDSVFWTVRVALKGH